MKIYSRLGNWVMFFLLIAAVTAGILLTKFAPDPQLPPDVPKMDWKQQLIQQNIGMQNGLDQGQIPPEQKDMVLKEIKMNDYRIQHNVAPLEDKSLASVVLDSKFLMNMVSIFTIIVAGGMLAGEFSTGTIKLLLIRPVNRTKILVSKYLTTLGFSLLLVLVLFLSSFLIGSIFFGFSGMDNPQIFYANGQVLQRSVLTETFIQYGLGAIDLIMWVTFAFMISAVFRNSALAIGISIFILFTSSPLLMFLKDYSWSKFLLFSNTNLAVYFGGEPPVKGMTLSFSIWMLVIYYVIFQALAWFAFKKRDVAA